MNLPSTAPLFLPAFRGLYHGHEDLFEPHTERKLPMVHCYAFGPKHDLVADPEAWVPRREVCEEVSRLLGARVSVDGEGEADAEGKTETEVWDVRDVAPNKRQYCASFRIPRSVAFAARVARKQADVEHANGDGVQHETVQE